MRTVKVSNSLRNRSVYDYRDKNTDGPRYSQFFFTQKTILFPLTCGIWWYAKIALISAPNGWVEPQLTNRAGVKWWYASYTYSKRAIMFSPIFVAHLRVWGHTCNACHVHLSTEQWPNTKLLRAELTLAQNINNQITSSEEYYTLNLRPPNHVTELPDKSATAAYR
jgi:hypothetical protein